MIVLLDSNVLLRAFVRPKEEHRKFLDAISEFQRAGYDFVCLPGQVRKVYAVLTRSAEKNGFGLTPEICDREIGRLLDAVRILPDQPEVLPRWRELVVQTKTTGIDAHDAFLAATAIVLDCPLLTADEDFLKYPGLEIRLV